MIETSHKVLLFIGNGFDCDLGLKTKYQDFVKSDYFKRNVSKRLNYSDLKDPEYDFSIFDYLMFKYNENQNWIDIEHELLSLATRESKRLNYGTGIYEQELPKSTQFQEETFYKLKEELNDYLLNINYNINKEAYSYRLVQIIIQSPFSKIVSFNYTPLNLLCGFSLLIEPCFHVHGCLSNNDKQSIILGFHDNVEIDKSYCYMIKSHQPSYYSSHIPDLLEDVDEIIFFGLSLGDVDYPYFSDFFKKQCISNKIRNRKFISFFTYDEKSRQDILYQLRMMNDKRTRYFFEYSNLNFFRTKDKMDNGKIETFFKDLKKRMFGLKNMNK